MSHQEYNSILNLYKTMKYDECFKQFVLYQIKYRDMESMYQITFMMRQKLLSDSSLSWLNIRKEQGCCVAQHILGNVSSDAKRYDIAHTLYSKSIYQGTQ